MNLQSFLFDYPLFLFFTQDYTGYVDKCVFCNIAQGKTNRGILFENDNAVVFKSKKPVCQHHFLAVPKTHITNFLDIKSDQSQILTDMVCALQETVKKHNISSAYRLAINGGKNIEVHHFHIHLLAGRVFVKNIVTRMMNSVI